ncbi:MAG: VacJ family lipoprotein [Desulfobulbus sp.]
MILANKTIKKLSVFTLALLAAFFVGGCAKQQDSCLEPPLHTPENTLNPNITYVVDVYDPLEGMNRRIYTFNYYFDKFLFLPVVNTYEFITPDYVEDRISNFVDNIFEFDNFTNNLLQLEFRGVAITLGRFLINSTLGIAGFWDPATDLDMVRQTEDFGQTLGRWGVGNGPYIVLPIFGPSNLRDTTGLITDSVAFSVIGPQAWVDDDDTTLIFSGVTAVDKRHRQSFRYYQTGSPFEYEMIRMLYDSKRQIEILK